MTRVITTLIGAIALAIISAACASTGAVPRPFPAPGADAPAADRPSSTETERAGGGNVAALISTALDLRGVPYRNGGSDPNGFDCSGFTQWVFAQHGILLPREVRDQFRTGATVRPADLLPGDLLFFRTNAAGASHVAIAIGGNEFVHAPSSTGVVRVEPLGSSYWSERFVGARRMVE